MGRVAADIRVCPVCLHYTRVTTVVGAHLDGIERLCIMSGRRPIGGPAQAAA